MHDIVMCATKKVLVDEGFFIRKEVGNTCTKYASNLAKGGDRVSFCKDAKGDYDYASWAEVCEYFGLGEYYNSLPERVENVSTYEDWRDDRDFCREVSFTRLSFPREDFVKKLFLGAELTLRWREPSEPSELWVELWVDGRPVKYVITDILLSDEGSELLDKVTGE